MKRILMVAGCLVILMVGLAGYLAWYGAARYQLRRSLSGQIRNAPCQVVAPTKRTLFPVYPNKFIDRNGHVVLELEVDNVEDFADGLALIWRYGEHGLRHGYVDS